MTNAQALVELNEADVALFQAVAGYHSPSLDRVIPVLSEAANHSRLWIGIAALMAIVGGRKGRSTAAEALTAVGITSAVANLAAKNLVRRKRPQSSVPERRRLAQPESSSFPSGHTASAAAFSSVVGDEIPMTYIPLTGLAAAVGFSRVYTGVHYPGDVLVGWLLGRIIGGLVRVVWPKRWK
jgi:membrane-associated phospholipid phosphatase